MKGGTLNENKRKYLLGALGVLVGLIGAMSVIYALATSYSSADDAFVAGSSSLLGVATVTSLATLVTCVAAARHITRPTPRSPKIWAGCAAVMIVLAWWTFHETGVLKATLG